MVHFHAIFNRFDLYPVQSAQAIVEAGVVPILAPLIQHPDAKLKRQVCAVLAQIAKHSVELAQIVVEGQIFPNLLACLKDMDLVVRKHAATLIREVAKHTAEMSTLILNTGGHVALIDFISESKGNTRLPGIMSLGYIASFSETNALAIVTHHGIGPLKDALVHEMEDHIKAAAAWSLCQVGRHSPDHARALAVADVFSKLVDAYTNPASSEDLQQKAQRGLKSVLQKCTYCPAMEPLLHTAPEKIVKYLVQQFAKVLPTQDPAKKSVQLAFVMAFFVLVGLAFDTFSYIALPASL
jgi:hypothetical protein